MNVFNSISTICGIALALILSLAPLSGQVIYVAQDATGDGSSWQNATGDLKTALSNAVAGNEIWISGGTYTPLSCTTCSFEERDTRFVLPKGVKLRGGFKGTETSLEDRTDTASTSGPSSTVVLSGQIETGVEASNSFTVLEIIAPTPGTLVERITFEKGLADDTTRGSSNRGSSGALIYITSYNATDHITLSLDRCEFKNGIAVGYGGGVFVGADFDKESNLTITDCNFTSNEAALGGGGLTINSSFEGHDVSTLTNCNFDLNKAGTEGGAGVLLRAAEEGEAFSQFANVNFNQNETITGEGGGMRLYGKDGNCSPTLNNTTFISNSAHFGGGLNIDAGNGGISNPRLNDCHFSQNQSSNAGAAIYVAAVFGGHADYEMYRCTLDNNFSGESGGAVLVNAIEGSSRALYRDCRFINNEATLYGGAVYNLGKTGVCSPNFINCIIADNKASSAGGVYCLGSEDGESNPFILNCIFEGNEAMVGGALYSNGNDETGTAEPFVANTVFFNNHADNGRTLRIIHARPHLLNCYIDELDCPSLNSGFGGEPICLTGNQFNTADIFDRSLAPYSYQALANSPIIDGGNDSILISNEIFDDLLGDARYRGMAVDIGPYERSSDPLLLEIDVDSSSISACNGDEVTMTATLNPPYPQGAINWTVNGSQVNQGSTYTIRDLTQSETIQVSGSHLGVSSTTEVILTVLPTITTALSTDVSSLPDSLCVDSTYQFSGIIDANGADFSVEWSDENGTSVGDQAVLNVSPLTTGSFVRTIEVAFEGMCLDTASRTASVEFEVIDCTISNTRQLVDSKSLMAYPNPVSDHVSLYGLQSKHTSSVHIYNSMGQDVYSGMISAFDTSLNVYSLPQGLYTIIVIDGQTIYRVLIEKL